MFRKNSSNILDALRDHINDSYYLYKICEGCDKLVLTEHPVCPNCKTYRFNTNKRKVIGEIKKLIDSEIDIFSELL